jgi:hypothetical protein
MVQNATGDRCQTSSSEDQKENQKKKRQKMVKFLDALKGS